MSEPPPIPVRPTRIPTPSPKAMTSGSISQRLGGSGRVQAALDLVGAGPAPGPALARQRAGRAADRRVAAVVQLVIRDVVLEDVVPHVAVGPARERVGLP